MILTPWVSKELKFALASSECCRKCTENKLVRKWLETARILWQEIIEFGLKSGIGFSSGLQQVLHQSIDVRQKMWRCCQERYNSFNLQLQVGFSCYEVGGECITLVKEWRKRSNSALSMGKEVIPVWIFSFSRRTSIILLNQFLFYNQGPKQSQGPKQRHR